MPSSLSFDAKPPLCLLILAVAVLAGCAAKPIVFVSDNLERHALKGKILAVGGFAARDVMAYPGQAEEAAILEGAGKALQRRFKVSQVMTAEAAWAAAGTPPTKFSPRVPIIIGSRLTPAFIRQSRTHGVDYLLWIDLHDNAVDNGRRQWVSTRTESTSCNCSHKSGAKCSPSYCGSTCNGSCCQSRRTVTEYHSSASARRSLKASYSLLDTTSGKAAWRADVTLSMSNVDGVTSESGYPASPNTPLPPTESQMMKRMSTAAFARLPK